MADLVDPNVAIEDALKKAYARLRASDRPELARGVFVHALAELGYHVAGVAAGPQATPGQVLYDGPTHAPASKGDLGRSLISRHLAVPPGTRVRVVAVPTDPGDEESPTP